MDCLKFGKCVFMAEKVIYLGLTTTKEPHNVSELKSFFGLINY